MENLTLSMNAELEDAYSGFFLSRGEGIHPKRRFDYYALFFLTGGTMGMREEGNDFDLQHGETLLLVPNREHEGTAPYPPGLNLYWINFKIQTQKNPKPVLRIPQHTKIVRPMRLIELFRLFLDDQESASQNFLQRKLLLFLILSEISLSENLPINHPWGNLVSKAHVIISSRCHEPVSTHTIAGELACNPDYLSRLYKKTTGLTVTEDLHRKRVHLAKKKLLESQFNVSEIAFNCGFENVSHFHRIFKKITGLTPGEYRKNHNRMFTDTR